MNAQVNDLGIHDLVDPTLQHKMVLVLRTARGVCNSGHVTRRRRRFLVRVESEHKIDAGSGPGGYSGLLPVSANLRYLIFTPDPRVGCR